MARAAEPPVSVPEPVAAAAPAPVVAAAPPPAEAGPVLALPAPPAAAPLLLLEAPGGAVPRATAAANAAPATTGAAEGPFQPTYEWQEVGARAIPRGLDVKAPLDGSGGVRARIPPSWRLVVDAGRDLGFVRLDVARHSATADVRREVEERVGGPVDVLADGVPVPVGDGITVETVELFGKKVTAKLVDPAAPPRARNSAIPRR